MKFPFGALWSDNGRSHKNTIIYLFKDIWNQILFVCYVWFAPHTCWEIKTFDCEFVEHDEFQCFYIVKISSGGS